MTRAAGAAPDPFTALGLRPDPGLTDDDVRVAWRRVAAATHPDRADGGDPARFAVAAAAYTRLRTRHDRGEAIADLAGQHPAGQRQARQIRAGRLILRIAVAAAAALAGLLAAGPRPAGPAIAVGALTWLAVTGRRDIGHR